MEASGKIWLDSVACQRATLCPHIRSRHTAQTSVITKKFARRSHGDRTKAHYQ